MLHIFASPSGNDILSITADYKQVIVLYSVFIPVAFIHNYFHEFGHRLIGTFIGNDVGISLNGVWPLTGHYLSVNDGLFVGIGGPAFSILLALIFMLVIERNKFTYAYPRCFSRFIHVFLV